MPVYLFDIKKVTTNAKPVSYESALKCKVHIQMMHILDVSKRQPGFLCSTNGLDSLFMTAAIEFEKRNDKTLYEIVIELFKQELLSEQPVSELRNVQSGTQINKILYHTLLQYQNCVKELHTIAQNELNADKIVYPAPNQGLLIDLPQEPQFKVNRVAPANIPQYNAEVTRRASIPPSQNPVQPVIAVDRRVPIMQYMPNQKTVQNVQFTYPLSVPVNHQKGAYLDFEDNNHSINYETAFRQQVNNEDERYAEFFREQDLLQKRLAQEAEDAEFARKLAEELNGPN